MRVGWREKRGSGEKETKGIRKGGESGKKGKWMDGREEGGAGREEVERRRKERMKGVGEGGEGGRDRGVDERGRKKGRRRGGRKGRKKGEGDGGGDVKERYKQILGVGEEKEEWSEWPLTEEEENEGKTRVKEKGGEGKTRRTDRRGNIEK